MCTRNSFYLDSPTPLTPKGENGHQSKDLTFPNIPPCSCGSHRAFECQLMPSVLHILDVDKYAPKEDSQQSLQRDVEIERILSKNSGGMNWGTIAVYSCAMSCESSTDEFVVVQEPADGVPKKRALKEVGDNMENDDW